MSDMTAQTHLYRRKAKYYFRRKVPADLQPYLGRAEEKFSLKTTDFNEAKRLARQASVDFDRKCAEVRQQFQSEGSGQQTVLDEATISQLCNLWRYLSLDGDEKTRQEGLSVAEFEDLAQSRAETQTSLRQVLARGQVDRIEPALLQFLSLLGVNVSGNSEAWQRLRYRFLQTAAEVHTAQIQRDAGEVIWTPPAPDSASLRPAPVGSTSLQTLFEDWKRFEANRPEKTIDDVKRTIDEFQRVVGRKSAEDITRQDLMTYRDYLVNDLKRKSKTVEKRITFISALFNVAINYSKLDVNPASRIPIPKDDSDERLPYDMDDLKAIFSSPLYTDGVRLGRDTGEAAVWLPLLSLFQGAREEELGQLLVTDVAKIDGIWCLLIIGTDKKGKVKPANAKHLKNRSSRRRLPIHPKVIEAGFLRYVQKIKDEQHLRLFPTLKPDRYGKLTSGFSKAYMEYTRETLGITDPNKVFHSLRHNFRDACREANLGEEMSDALMGHSSHGKTGRGYGRSFSLAKRHEAICRISYPGLHIPVIVSEDDK